MENSKKIDISEKKEKILKKIKKFNPYRKILRNPVDGKLLEPLSMVYYQKFSRWLIKILLNGFFLWFILFTFRLQPIHIICILGDGILVYFTLEILKEIVRIIK